VLTHITDAIVETIKTENVIAQTVEGDPENCVMLGGHSDSVAAGPGINLISSFFRSMLIRDIRHKRRWQWFYHSIGTSSTIDEILSQ